MAERAPVKCEECGQAYSARIVGDDVVLPTDDGKCECGSDRFSDVSKPEDAEETAG